MAGDWIKVECVTPDKPEVDMMASQLNIDHDCVVGKLIRLWIWADQQSVSGNGMSVTEKMIDRITFQPGFGSALRLVKWLDGDDGALSLPNFEQHNGQTAKTRAATNRRVAKSRAKCNAPTVTETEQKALPEKRREEIEKITNNNTPPAEKGDDKELLKSIWEIYPQIGRGRSSKKQVAAEWKKIKKSDKPTQDEIVNSLRGWITCSEWQRDNGQAIQGVHLWIKNERWEDTPNPQQQTNKHHVTEYLGE